MAVLLVAVSMPTPTDLLVHFARDRGRIANLLDQPIRGAPNPLNHHTHENSRVKKIAIWNAILTCEIETGSTFAIAMPERTGYLIVGVTQEIIPIPRSNQGGGRFWAYLHMRYGLNSSDPISRYALAEFQSYAEQHGTRVGLRRFAAYKESTVYLSSYDGSMWRLDGQDIMPLRIGEDDVFFADDDGGTHIDPHVGEHNGILFEHLVNSVSFAESGMGGITAEQMKRAYIVWIFALAFPDLLPTKPLLILEGAPGSGKTSTVQMLQLALLGAKKSIQLQRNREDDFGMLLMRSPICVFDNLDAYVDWVPDAVCAYATGGLWVKRKLFTDDEQIITKPHAFIAVASKNPASFRREDVADRCIILRLERRRESTSQKKLEANITEHRAQIFGEYLHYVNKIVDEIRCGYMTDDEAFRMADFASFARVVARALDWEDGAVDDMLAALQGEQSAFINEEDPLTDLLHKWLSYKPRNAPSNIGRLVELSRMHNELESIAQMSGITYYKSSRMLAQKLRSPHVERDFIIQMAAANGYKSYRIWRRTDPRLTLVPMPGEAASTDTEVEEAVTEDD